MLHVMVLAGGSGTRFWPRSRKSLPKQLLSFGSDVSLLVETVQRVQSLAPPGRVWVVGNAEYADQIRALLPEVPAQQVIGEPVGRDTAAAIGLGTLAIRRVDPEATVLVLPADQRIAPVDAFSAAVRAADQWLEQRPEQMVVFGIPPTYPATGYGYVERGASAASHAGHCVFEVKAFREKPDQQTAERFLEQGSYFWNAGIFCFRAATLMALVEEQLPELARGLEEIAAALGGPDFESTLERCYAALPKISIDFGIMEHCPNRSMVETRFDWDDVGSWLALARHHAADGAGNVSRGHTVAVDSSDNVVDAGEGMVGLIGVSGLVVVHTPDATLVCRKEDAERVKELLERVQDRGDLGRFL